MMAGVSLDTTRRSAWNDSSTSWSKAAASRQTGRPRAAELRGKRISLRMPDALILATADLHEEVDTVLCANAEWSKVKGLSCKVELLKVAG